jgi:hypothetical protein
MAKVSFTKATRKQIKLRMAIDGPSGGGKTYTALRLAFLLAGPDGKVAVIDTERKSASKYLGESPDGFPWNFDVLELEKFHPQRYIEGIDAAEEGGYDVLVIDSLSHAWEGEGGVLDIHNEATKRQRVENSFTAWRDVTPIHRSLVERMLQSHLHLIVTMRSKMEYVITTDDKGKQAIQKLGLAPVQRAGMEYEFDVVLDMTEKHDGIVSKTRCSAIADMVISKPGTALATPIKEWLALGVEEPKPDPEIEKLIAELKELSEQRGKEWKQMKILLTRYYKRNDFKDLTKEDLEDAIASSRKVLKEAEDKKAAEVAATATEETK